MGIIRRVTDGDSPELAELCATTGVCPSMRPPLASGSGREPPPSDCSQTRLQGLRVLLVDDDEQACRFIGRSLSRTGADVRTAKNGLQALALLDEARFDLIVSDIHMPYMDGIELLSAVRAKDNEVSFMVVTGEPKLDSALAALNQGVVSYLTKPIDASELLTVAEKVRTHAMLAQVRRNLTEATAAATRPPPSAKQGDLELALDGLYMVFQPVVHFPSGAVFAHEALVRTRYLAVPHPGALFALGTELGQVPRIGQQIRTACGQVVSKLPPDTLLFINLHMNEIFAPNFLEQSEGLRESAHRIVFEITERAEGRDIEAVSEQILNLRKLGFRIAIDDIGAGYAGLNSFAILEPDVVKLDMALVRGVESSKTRQRLILALAELCYGMHIDLVAEGVETREEVETLASLGVELFQGYYFARPGENFMERVHQATPATQT